MQDVFIQKPYRFIPPFTGDLMPTLIRDFSLFRRHLRITEGVVDYECRHAERLSASVARGDSIVLAPNHARTADPMVIGFLSKETKTLFWAMASWHLFHQSAFAAFAMRVIGAFSINREGLDRQAIDYAVARLDEAKRPLVLFAEGTASRVNDRLLPLLDGLAFVARTAAKKRQKRDGGKVVVHPVAIKYCYQGDIREAVIPVLDSIEKRLSWRSQSNVPLLRRIRRVGNALLMLKEFEYLGRVSEGKSIADRQSDLIEFLLRPLEEEWLGTTAESGVVSRIKNLRMKILPDMIKSEMDDAEKERRWRQIENTYLAQQISCYPPGYLSERLSVDRILETVERFEEDLTDKATIHGKLKVILHVDEPIEVSTKRDRRAEVDPVMGELRIRLQTILDEMALESPLYDEPLSAQPTAQAR